MAGAIFMLAPLGTVNNDGLYQAPKTYPPLTGGYYFPTLDKSNLDAQLDIVASALNNPNAMVIFGSSEMGDNRQNMPYQFFPENRNRPVVAVGQAHFEIFATYMMLQSLHEHIRPRAKIVLMLSPGWMVDGQLLPYAFDKFLGGKIARTVAKRGTSDGKLRLQAYVHRNGKQLNFEMAYGCWYNICGGRTGIKILQGVFDKIAQRSRDWRAVLVSEQTNPKPIQPQYALGQKTTDWVAYLPKLRQAELALHTNNDYDIRDDYYDKHVRHSRAGLPKSAYDKVVDYSGEMSALAGLLQLLREKNADATFVITPINPYGYTDVDFFYPINTHIKTMIGGYGFPVYDMYTEPYEDGTLSDLFHLSPYGWAKVNQYLTGGYDE